LNNIISLGWFNPPLRFSKTGYFTHNL